MSLVFLTLFSSHSICRMISMSILTDDPRALSLRSECTVEFILKIPFSEGPSSHSRPNVQIFSTFKFTCSDFFVAFSTCALGIEVKLFGIFHAFRLNQNQIVTVKIVTSHRGLKYLLFTFLEIGYGKQIRKKRIIKLINYNINLI